MSVRGVARQGGRFAWRLLKGILMVLMLCAALVGAVPLGVFGREPRPGPPRPQGAVTQVVRKKKR